MRDPSYLPLELFDLILSHVLYPDSPKPHRQIKKLSILSRIDRRWSSAITPRLYADWHYNGTLHSFESLWCFFRTIVNNPHLARLVRSVTSDHARDMDDDHDVKVLDQVDMLERVIHEAGLHHLELEFMCALQDPTTCNAALTALLLSHLPNLKSLEVLISPDDRFLPIVFKSARKGPPAGMGETIQPPSPSFQNLEHALISFRRSTKCCLFPLSEIFLFPRMRKLHLHGVIPDGLASLLPDEYAGTSPITHLTLSYDFMKKADERDIEAILSIPKALENLDLFHGVPARCSSPNPIQLLSHSPTFWSAVERHRDSLRTLDLYQSVLYRRSKHHDPVSEEMMRSLPRLTRLTNVSLPYQLFPNPARDLPRILPSGVASLDLYKSHSDEDGLRSLDLSLSEMIRDKKFPALRSLSLADRVGFTPRTRVACRELDIHCSYYTPASSYYY